MVTSPGCGDVRDGEGQGGGQQDTEGSQRLYSGEGIVTQIMFRELGFCIYCIILVSKYSVSLWDYW